MINNKLPCISTLSINLRNHLFIFLVYNVRLDIEKIFLHLKMLLFVINNVEKVIDNFYVLR